jgi:CheY-like chemotaxis protein
MHPLCPGNPIATKGRAKPGVTMKILVVEDHEDTRHVLERLLSRKGFEVTSAENVENGLNLLRSKSFGAIVSDIMLPDGTGYGLISEARRNGVASLAIALSAYNYPLEVNEPKLTGFDYHLPKPIDCEKLLSILETARSADGDGNISKRE